MTHPTPNLAPPDSPPDWSAHPDPVPCPLCTYDLRNLPTPRCPECGYSFTWPALLESRRTVHPYLFEHHPERNLPSLARTLLAGLLPRRFWRTLTPLHPVRPRRLAIYYLLVTALTFLAAALPYADAARNYYAYATTARAGQLAFVNNPANAPLARYYTQTYGSVQAFLDRYYPVPTVRSSLAHAWPEGRKHLLFYAYFAAWPFLTTLVLLIYRRSTRQAAIRPAQILRCTIYSADAGVSLATLAAACAAYTAWVLNTHTGGIPLLYNLIDLSHRYPATPWSILLLLLTYRLTTAYSHYLRFRTAWLAVPLAQVVVLLIYCQLYVYLIGFLPR